MVRLDFLGHLLSGHHCHLMTVLNAVLVASALLLMVLVGVLEFPLPSLGLACDIYMWFLCCQPYLKKCILGSSIQG